MHTEDLFEQCLQALSNGQELPAELARYLARHPEQRAEIEDLLFVAQRAAQLPAPELAGERREAMQARLAARFGFDPAIISAKDQALRQPMSPMSPMSLPIANRPKRIISRLPLVRLRHAHSPTTEDEMAAARISAAFRDLTPEDIRRYIGVRGEDYLYYRQRFPQWELIFAFLAAILRGFKRLEKLTNIYS